MKLRVMTYNLLYASHERQGDTMIFQEERARAVREVVRACAPDVLGLTEAVYCGAGRGRLIRPDYAAMFGLEHVHAAGFDGDWGNCLVSRFPILRVECLPLGGGRREVTSSALRATLDCDGREVHVDLVHPSPAVTEAERVEAFRPLLSTLKRPYLMMGDLNALSDEDPYEHATLVAELTGTSLRPRSSAPSTSRSWRTTPPIAPPITSRSSPTWCSSPADRRPATGDRRPAVGRGPRWYAVARCGSGAPRRSCHGC